MLKKVEKAMKKALQGEADYNLADAQDHERFTAMLMKTARKENMLVRDVIYLVADQTFDEYIEENAPTPHIVH